MGGSGPCTAEPAAALEEELESLVEAGIEHLEGQQFVQALKAYSRAVDLSPDSTGAWIGKVTALQRLKRPRGALKACALALQRLPDCQPLLLAHAELSAELGAEAQEILDEAAGKARPPLAVEDDEASTDEGGDAALEDAPCPAATSQEQSQKEATSLRSRLARSVDLESELKDIASPESAAFRAVRKEELTSFYREFYATTRAQIEAATAKSKLDTSQYSKEEKTGLSIKDGHRPMPRPEKVELPVDHLQPVGVLTAAELACFSCDNPRHLISLHGDLFDVSDRPDKYGPDGPYHSMSGHDITWALWSGYDEEEEWDKYYDVLRCAEREERDRRFQGLMSWWAFFESEYGSPVGRLDAYSCEWELPSPPKVQDLCVVM